MGPVSSSKLFLEPANDVLDCATQHSQLFPGGRVIHGRKILKKDLELSARFDAYFAGCNTRGTFDLEPQEVILTAENVAGKPLSADGFESF